MTVPRVETTKDPMHPSLLEKNANTLLLDASGSGECRN